MSNELVAQSQQLSASLNSMQPQFKASLPAHISPERFIKVVMTAVNLNPSLLKADRRSLYNSCMKAASDGLLLDGRQAALVAFGEQIQYMPMVAGIMRLVRNSGEIKNWSVHSVFENDKFDYELGDDERIMHKPALTNRGDLLGVYSIVTLDGGEKSREFMSKAEVDAIRQRSRSKGNGPWVTDYEQMALKTIIRRHAKRLPTSTDLDDFMSRDETTEIDLTPDIPPAVEKVEKPKRRTALDKVADSIREQQIEPDHAEGPFEEPPVHALGNLAGDDI